MESAMLCQQPCLRAFSSQRSSMGRPKGILPGLVSLRGNPSIGLRNGRSGCSAHAVTATKNKKRLEYSARTPDQELLVSVEPDYSDLWRLEKVVEMIKDGAVGIIPTDTFPAFVCNLEDKDAIRRLYNVKEMNPSKPLSIMVRDFADIDKYTHGFPNSNVPGRPDIFRLARQCLPGPYTFILAASKSLPKQCLDFQTGRSKSRKTVGVRMPDHPICQSILNQLDAPLLVSSVPLEAPDMQEFEDEPIVPDPVYMMDVYGRRGIEFVVDCGPYVGPVVGSTVVGMSTGAIEVFRVGKGDASLFEGY